MFGFVTARSRSRGLVIATGSIAWCVALVACAIPGTAEAQSATTGNVVGTVSNDNRRPLAGAIVRSLDGIAEASTGRDGRFFISGVSAGEHRFVAHYLGFLPETVSVSVANGRSAHAEVVLAHPVQMLDVIRVEGTVAGQAAALNQQRTANNVSSVVDAELVGRLPDRNLAEALGRVPGVALVRDQGEGRFVQIRGTSATLNSLSIDGMRVPSPEPASRQTPMDVIPSDMVSGIQVNKTLTPDMDADAIGGNVNLLTPSARSGAPTLAFNVAGGQNQINNGLLKNASGVAGARFGKDEKLGVLFGANYYSNDRGSQNYEMGWCVETTCNGVTPAQALDAPSQLALRDYSQILRTRRGTNGTIDYRFNDEHSVFVKGIYSRFADSEERYVTLANFGSGAYTVTDENHGTVTGARMDKELRLRPVAQQQRALQFGGNSVVGGNVSIDYTLQTALAKEDRPNSITMVWRQSGMAFAYDVSDEDNPKFTVNTGTPLDATKFTYNSLRFQTRHVSDDENSGKVNISRPFTIGSKEVVVKVGGSGRMMDRSSRDGSTRFLTTYRAGMAPPALPVTLASLQGPSRTSNFLDNRFVFGPQASSRAVRDFYENYKGALNIDTARSRVESNQASYDIGEDVYAGYAMATFDAGPIHVITGVRVENTKQETVGNIVTQAGQVVTITPQTKTKSYSNVLPSITGKWSLDDRTILRGAVTSSLVRPAFGDLAPATNVPDGNAVVATVGNPELDPIRSLNIDVMAERYFGSVGFVSAGFFHKSLSDFIYSTQRAVTAADNLGATVATVTRPENAESGKLTGFEVAWQQNLTMLPGLLSSLGLNANFTRTTSSTTFPSREGTESRLPGQAGNAGNFGVFYERSRLALRVGYNFADKYLEVIGATPQNDIYVASRGQLDLSGTFQVSTQAKLFFETNNLTNQPLRRYIGKSERSWQPGNEYYRSWGMIGMRIQP